MLESVSPVSHSWVKTGLAILGASTLALGAALLGAPGAHAATHYITEDDVAPYEAGDEDDLSTYNYDQWHVGTTYNPDATVEQSFLFGDCSVTAVNDGEYNTWPQLLKGYPINDRPTDEAAITPIIEGASLEVLSGEATLQFPIFVHIEDETGEPIDGSPFFTTLRTHPPASGIVEYDGLLTSTGTQLGGQGPIEEFFEFVRDAFFPESGGSEYRIELLGVGFNASAAQDTEVASITFDNNTYQFGNNCAPEEEEDATSPTPPEKVDTAFGSDALAITLMLGGVAIAAAALTIRRSQTE